MPKRLYLFDIDGTLINTGGAGGQAMRKAFAALWRRDDGFSGIEFSGRTDRAILRDALNATACSGNPFDDDIARFKQAYFRRLPGALRESEGLLIDGVRPFLDLLIQDPDATVGLATGNFHRGAHMKLLYYDIDAYFCAGGFGDRAENREDMVAGALRACRPFGVHADVFVIGDTVHDITSAKAHGAIAVGVTTGTTGAAALNAAGADIVLSSLADAPRHLLSGFPRIGG